MHIILLNCIRYHNTSQNRYNSYDVHKVTIMNNGSYTIVDIVLNFKIRKTMGKIWISPAVKRLISIPSKKQCSQCSVCSNNSSIISLANTNKSLKVGLWRKLLQYPLCVSNPFECMKHFPL